MRDNTLMNHSESNLRIKPSKFLEADDHPEGPHAIYYNEAEGLIAFVFKNILVFLGSNKVGCYGKNFPLRLETNVLSKDFRLAEDFLRTRTQSYWTRIRRTLCRHAPGRTKMEENYRGGLGSILLV